MSDGQVVKPSSLPCDQDSTASDIMKVASKGNEAVDKVTKALVFPMALCIAYLYALKLCLKESGSVGLPKAFSEDVSIVVPIVMTSLYLVFIPLGKKYMETREPMKIKNFMVAYNLYQSLLNIWCVERMISTVYHSGMSAWGNKVDTTAGGYQISFLIWLHYNNKYVELLDTVFMVLRKKNKQISFLHVFHHTLLIWSWFTVLKICGGGGDSYFGATVNSFIHVLMYTYYLCKLLNIEVPAFIKQNLTKCQMIQFCVCASHSIWCITTGHQVLLACVQLFVMVSMLILFGNFFYQSYMKKSKKKAAKKAQ
jgi:elongation of very long chain fatty acids protein 4